jgi:LEA14-like dessication related protein
VEETRAEWSEVEESATPIEMEFLVYNPQSYPIVFSELGYEITMNEVTVGEGAVEETHVIDAGDEEEVDLRTEMDADALDEWWVSHLDDEGAGHQVSELRIEFTAVIDLSALGGGEVTVPLDELTYEETVETDLFDEGLENESGSDEGDGEDPQGEDDRSDDGSADDGSESASADDETSGDGGNSNDADDGSAGDEGSVGDEDGDDWLPL